MALPWTEKYKPRTVKDFVNNKKALTQLNEWLLSWTTGNPKNKAAFLYGPSGVGKTTSVEILSTKHHFDLISLDASHWRTKKALDKIISTASTQHSLLARRRVILLDELEGMSGSLDRGGIATIAQLIRKKNFPIILIANNIWDRKFSNLRKACVHIKFQRIPKRSIIAHLLRICDMEGIEAEEKALQYIAEKAKGDLRSAITDLQALSLNQTFLHHDDISWFSERDRSEAIFNILGRVFNASTCIEAKKAVALADIDYEMLFEWIYENVPYHLSDIQDLNEALNALSKSDIYFNRIRTHQNWKWLKYAFDQMTAGVATAKKRSPNRWVRNKFPGRIMKLSQTMHARRLRRELGLKLSKKLHMGSDASIKTVLPYLRIIFQHDEETSQRIIDEFELDEKHVNYLMK